jgi:uncharacterized protein (DUF4415 family)
VKNPSRKTRKEIAALSRMKDADIDTSDLPEVADWSTAEVGKLYRPVKRPVTVRIDADVLAWLKSQGKGYQTRINRILRLAMSQRKARRNQKATGIRF